MTKMLRCKGEIGQLSSNALSIYLCPIAREEVAEYANRDSRVRLDLMFISSTS